MKIRMGNKQIAKQKKGANRHSLVGTLEITEHEMPLEKKNKCMYPGCEQIIYKNYLCKYHWLQEKNLE